MSKVACIIFLSFFVILITWIPLVAGNNGGAAFSTWPDTGQSLCFSYSYIPITCPDEGQPFHGQDAQYQGPSHPYTSLLGGTMVRDDVTGLIWEVKNNRDNTPDYSNPNDADNTYTWCNTNPAQNGGAPGTCNNTDTEDFINALNGANFGGYSDWRIPTVKELKTLQDYSRYAPSINTTFFPNAVSSSYWSSTARGDLIGGLAWLVDFDGGSVIWEFTQHPYYLRAVRDTH